MPLRILFVLLIAGCSHIEKPLPPASYPIQTELFRTHRPLTATIHFPFEELIRLPDRGNQLTVGELTRGVLALHQEGEPDYRVDVILRRIGNMSANVCAFPKLEVRWREKVQGADPKLISLFLVTHCNDAKKAGQWLPSGAQIAGQYLAHRLVEALDLPALRTRLGLLTYHDLDSGREIASQPAFFIEHVETLAARQQAIRSKEETKSYRDLNSGMVARVHLFEILTNNRDWRIFDLRPLGNHFRKKRSRSGTHNIFIIEPGKTQLRGCPTARIRGRGEGAERAATVPEYSGRGIPVPFDLELSSFVGIPQGIKVITGGRDETYLDLMAHEDFFNDKSRLFRWMAMRLQHLRRNFSRKDVAQAIEHFEERRERLEKLVEQSDVQEDAKKRAREHLTTFFEAIQPAHWVLPLTAKGTTVYEDATAQRPVCRMPSGIVVKSLREQDGMVEVVFLQKLIIDDEDPRPVCMKPDHTIFPSGWVKKKDVRATIQGEDADGDPLRR